MSFLELATELLKRPVTFLFLLGGLAFVLFLIRCRPRPPQHNEHDYSERDWNEDYY